MTTPTPLPMRVLQHLGSYRDGGCRVARLSEELGYPAGLDEACSELLRELKIVSYVIGSERYHSLTTYGWAYVS